MIASSHLPCQLAGEVNGKLVDAMHIYICTHTHVRAPISLLQIYQADVSFMNVPARVGAKHAATRQ